MTVSLWLLCFSCASGVACGGPGADVELAPERHDLLDARLSVQMPEGARAEPRPYSIMAAPVPNAEETRLMVDVEGGVMVLLAVELFSLAGDDVMADARRLIERWDPEGVADYSLEPIALSSGLDGVLIVPAAPPDSGGASRLLEALVRQPDGTLEYLAVLVDEGGAESWESMSGLARRVVGSLEPGGRRIDSSGGLRQLQSLSDRQGLQLWVPQGYAHTLRWGPDFLVHRLTQMVPVDRYQSRLGIYIGGHPGYQFQQSEETPDAVETFDGELLGGPTTWYRWVSPGLGEIGTVTHLEAVSPDGPGGEMVHVFLSAAESSELERLVEAAATLAVVETAIERAALE